MAQNSLVRSVYLSCSALVAGASLATVAMAAAPIQAKGRGAVVGEFASDLPPQEDHIQGFRTPLGLTLEAKPSSTVSLFIDLSFVYDNFPNQTKALGNTSDTPTSGKTDGSEVRQPLTLDYSMGRKSGEKRDQIEVGFAYMQWASDIALVRAGRMPRHWGLGIWRNAEWKPEGGAISTSDSLAVTVDFSPTFSGSMYWEKISEGSLYAKSDDADAFTVEALIADDLNDSNSYGMSKRVGLAFTNYEHKRTSTKMLIMDMFSEFYVGSFLGAGEILFPTGRTKAPAYQELGGGRACNLYQQNDEVEPLEQNLTCESQDIEGLAGLVKFFWQVGGTAKEPDKGFSLASTQLSQQRQPTALRNDSHIIGLTSGYARGDKEAYVSNSSYTPSKDDITPSSSVRATPMHPNIRPALLMFHDPAGMPTPGMPVGRVMNAFFVRGEYAYETAGFGMISPALIWGILDEANSVSGTQVQQADKSYKPATGPMDVAMGERILGYEMDLKYAYTTMDNVTLSLEGGVWFPGNAWRTTEFGKPSTVFGMRASASTTF